MYKISISPNNTAMKNTPNISLTPIKSCGSNLPCFKKCYALGPYKRYPSVKKAWDNNLAVAITNINQFRHDLEKYLTKHKPKYFRIHVAGDFFASHYVEMWRSISEQFPKTKFLAYTKRYDLDFSAMPKNMIIRYSFWGPTPNQWNIILTELNGELSAVTALSQLEETICQEKGIKRCPGVCGPCRHCWNSKKPVYFSLR